MKKLMIFPFTYSSREILIYRKYIEGFIVTAAVTWNQADLQFVLKKFGKSTDVFITTEYYAALAMCDSVLFLENGNKDMSNSVYKEYIQKAIENNKEVYFSQKCKELLKLENSINYGMSDMEYPLSLNKNYVKYIDVPTIGVMGLGDYCNKFCCEVEISSYFRQKGHRVIHIGSKDYSGMFGERRYPEFIWKSDESVTHRILKWNQYLFNLCENEKPDLIVLGMPGGIMPLNNKILNEFGEIPYIISNGIRIDEGILCSYFYEKVDKKYLLEYQNYCKYKLNCDVKWIGVSNSSCRFAPDSEESLLEYLHFGPEIADQMIIDTDDQLNIHTFNILNDTSKNNMLCQVYEELTESVSAF